MSSAFVEVADSNNYYFTNVRDNDMIFRTDSNTQQIHFGVNSNAMSQMVIDSNAINLLGNLSISRPVTLNGIEISRKSDIGGSVNVSYVVKSIAGYTQDSASNINISGSNTVSFTCKGVSVASFNSNSLSIGTTRITNTGVLENVTTDASNITTGLLSTARGGTGTSNVTGTGSNVFSDSPTFTGTITAQTLNATTVQTGGTTRITNTGVLQNVTTDASNITTGLLSTLRGGTGTSNVTGTGAVVFSLSPTISNLTLAGNVLPSSNLTYDIGSSNLRFRDLYLSGNTIDLAGIKLTTTANSNINVGGINVAAIQKKTQTNKVRAQNILSSIKNNTNFVAGNYYAIVWSPELSIFCAVRSNGDFTAVTTSPDGINWTMRTVPVANHTWRGLCWSPEKMLFVASAQGPQSGTSTEHIMTSPDGITWTMRQASSCTTVCWSPELSLFLAGGSTMQTSSDGFTWQTSSSLFAGFVLWIAELGVFLALGSRPYTSPNGVNWTLQNLESNSWRGRCWSPELSLVVVVSSSTTAGANRIAVSKNCVDWTVIIPPEDNQMYSVSWSPELSHFVIVCITGTNRIFISPDGYNWSALSTPIANPTLTDITWSSELSIFVIIGITGNNVLYTEPALPSSRSTLIVNPAFVSMSNNIINGTIINASTALQTNGTTRITSAGLLQNVTTDASNITTGLLSTARGGTGTSNVTGASNLVLSHGPTLTGTLVCSMDSTLGAVYPGSLYAGDPGTGQLWLTGASNGNKKLAFLYDTTSNIACVQSMIQNVGPTPLCLNAAGGNVGINTVAPTQALDVNGSIATGGTIRITSAGVLQNVTTDASNITTGNLNFARLPKTYIGTWSTVDTIYSLTVATNGFSPIKLIGGGPFVGYNLESSNITTASGGNAFVPPVSGVWEFALSVRSTHTGDVLMYQVGTGNHIAAGGTVTPNIWTHSSMIANVLASSNYGFSVYNGTVATTQTVDSRMFSAKLLQQIS